MIKRQMNKSLFFLKLSFLLIAKVSLAQYDTTHYIPYLADLTGAQSMANLEYGGSFDGAYFIFGLHLLA